MANKVKSKKNMDANPEAIEDVTMYGEFIASFDQWMTLDKQRKNAHYLEEITKEISPGAYDITRDSNIEDDTKSSNGNKKQLEK